MTCPATSATNLSPRSDMVTRVIEVSASRMESCGSVPLVFRSRRNGGNLPMLTLSHKMRVGEPGLKERFYRDFYRNHLAARKRALSETIRYLEESLGKRSRSKGLCSARADMKAVNAMIMAMGPA